jgi:hypothetical protein
MQIILQDSFVQNSIPSRTDTETNLFSSASLVGLGSGGVGVVVS